MSNKAVIVKFRDQKFSAKTEKTCFWCRSRFWDTEELARKELKALGYDPVAETINYNDELPQGLNRKVASLLKTG